MTPEANSWLAYRTPDGDLPLVNTTDWGETCAEWWVGDRKLTLYLGPETVEYIKVWGPCLDAEMEDGVVEDFQAL